MKAGETTVLKLLQGSKVFLIPNFQRRYSWRAKEWELLWSDLIREAGVDHSTSSQDLDGHFLGSIVLHPAGGTASVLMQHLVIDGQQRLTTILILLAALRDVRSETDDSWDPKEYDTKYLTNPYDPDHPDRLVPTELDRHAYIQTMRYRNPTEGIGQAYTFFEKKIRELVRASSIPLEDLGNTLLLHMLMVEINTGTGDSVNNIFNTLNSKGRPLTAADLVRNELLLHIGEEQGHRAYEKYWTPMERSLVVEKRDGFDDKEFVSFLWSREVSFDPKTTRQDLFPTFERRLRKSLDQLPLNERREKALESFRDLYYDHHLFLVLRDPLNHQDGVPPLQDELRFELDRLRRWGSEPTTPLALWLLKEAVAGTIDQSEAAASIDLLLGYLGRRALAGVPTNLLNRILTPIAHRLSNRRKKPVADELRDFLSAPGSYWPPDSEVLSAVVRQPLFFSAKRQIKFLLGEAERLASDAQLVNIAELQVEHVMPQALSPQWEDDILIGGWDLDSARSLLHTLGNLTLTVSDHQTGNSPFPEKGHIYQESPLQINRQLALKKTFLPQDIEERSTELARLLLKGLPGPIGAQDTPREIGLTVSDRLETVLQAMAEGEWTTEVQLVEFLGTDLVDLRRHANALSPVIARLIRDANGMIPTWFSNDLLTAVEEQSFPADPHDVVTSARLGELFREIDQSYDESDTDDYGVS